MNKKKYNIMTREYEGKLLVFLYEDNKDINLDSTDTIDVIFLTRYCDENLTIEYGYNRFDLRSEHIADINTIEDSVYHYSFISQDYEFYCDSQRTSFNEVVELLKDDIPNIAEIFKKYHDQMYLF